MRIDSLKNAPDRMGRYWVTFSDGSRIGFYRQTVEDHGLYAGKELEQEEYQKLLEDHKKMSARMRAVRIVSASSVSASDLEQRLIHKGEDPQEAHRAVAWMQDMDLVDDGKMAAQVVQRSIAKGYGLARAKQALYEKRIPKEYWAEALADYPDQTDKIADFLRGKLGENWDEKDLKRAMDAALRRGHSYGQIRKALTQLSMPDEDLPEEW